MLSNKQYIGHQLIILAFSLFFSFKANAQKVRVIDNKGTIKIANKNRFFSSNTDPKTSKTMVEGDIWYNNNKKVTKIWYVYKDSNGEEKGRWEDLINKANIFPPIVSDTSSVLTLSNKHHTIIAKPRDGGTDMIIKFPKPSEHLGKIYKIKNLVNQPITLECISCEQNSFTNSNGESTNQITYNSGILIFQSDGVKWQQINN